MKTAIEVNRDILNACINEAESSGPLSNRNELFEKVSSLYNFAATQKNLKPIKPGVVYLRVRDWNLPVKTPVGKRGRQPGVKIVRGHRADRFAQDPSIVNSFNHLRAEVKKNEPRFLPIVDRIQDGSMKAAVKLHCLECCDYKSAEVAQCTVVSCPLFAFRPYKQKVS